MQPASSATLAAFEARANRAGGVARDKGLRGTPPAHAPGTQRLLRSLTAEARADPSITTTMNNETQQHHSLSSDPVARRAFVPRPPAVPALAAKPLLSRRPLLPPRRAAAVVGGVGGADTGEEEEKSANVEMSTNPDVESTTLPSTTTTTAAGPAAVDRASGVVDAQVMWRDLLTLKDVLPDFESADNIPDAVWTWINLASGWPIEVFVLFISQVILLQGGAIQRNAFFYEGEFTAVFQPAAASPWETPSFVELRRLVRFYPPDDTCSEPGQPSPSALGTPMWLVFASLAGLQDVACVLTLEPDGQFLAFCPADYPWVAEAVTRAVDALRAEQWGNCADPEQGWVKFILPQQTLRSNILTPFYVMTRALGWPPGEFQDWMLQPERLLQEYDETGQAREDERQHLEALVQHRNFGILTRALGTVSWLAWCISWCVWQQKVHLAALATSYDPKDQEALALWPSFYIVDPATNEPVQSDARQLFDFFFDYESQLPVAASETVRTVLANVFGHCATPGSIADHMGWVQYLLPDAFQQNAGGGSGHHNPAVVFVPPGFENTFNLGNGFFNMAAIGSWDEPLPDKWKRFKPAVVPAKMPVFTF